MAVIATIAFIVSLGTAFAPQQTTQGYLQHLIGQKLILRHYAGTANSKAKERDLTTKTGGCDQAIEVMKVAFDTSSVRLTLRSIGTPFIRKKTRGCAVQRDVYSLTISDFAFDQRLDQAEDAIGHILQTPEAYLVASGTTWTPPPSSGNESSVDFPGPGLTAPEAVLSVTPDFSRASLKAPTELWVRVRCILGTDGLLYDPVIIKGVDEETNQRALAALTFWRLEPVRKSGLPVAAKIPVEFSFSQRF